MKSWHNLKVVKKMPWQNNYISAVSNFLELFIFEKQLLISNKISRYHRNFRTPSTQE